MVILADHFNLEVGDLYGHFGLDIGYLYDRDSVEATCRLF